jgi:RimJ/RimL family protein N-acetyltransferase
MTASTAHSNEQLFDHEPNTPQPARSFLAGFCQASPVDLQFVPIGDSEAETAALTEFLSGDEWPFHGTSRPSSKTVEGWIAAGRFTGSAMRSFWIRAANGDYAERSAETAIGVVTLRDLADPTAVFDLRVRSAYRGRGFGSAAVRWLTDYLFTEFPGITRIEGHTRRDNLAMQRVLERSGYVREAHHRQAWPSSDGTVHDSFGYAIIRPDWLSGDITPIEL